MILDHRNTAALSLDNLLENQEYHPAPSHNNPHDAPQNLLVPDLHIPLENQENHPAPGHNNPPDDASQNHPAPGLDNLPENQEYHPAPSHDNPPDVAPQNLPAPGHDNLEAKQYESLAVMTGLAQPGYQASTIHCTGYRHMTIWGVNQS